MPYPSVEEFKALILSTPLDQITRDYVFQRVPFIFRANPQAGDDLADHLCRDRLLRLKRSNITIVGSAKLGFSLNPLRFPRGILPTSDIDVLVVDQQLFDRVWLTLLS